MFHACWGTFFVSEDGEKLVDYIHENDGDFRTEYMSGIVEYFGGTVQHLNFEQPEEAESEEDYTTYFELCQNEIKKAIKKHVK